MLQLSILSCLFIFATVFQLCSGRIHRIEIMNDDRPYISLTSFGFYAEGYMSVKLTNFRVDNMPSTAGMFGFTLEKISNEAMDPNEDVNREECLLKNSRSINDSERDVIFFELDRKNNALLVNCYAGGDSLVKSMHIFPKANDVSLILTHKEILEETRELTGNVEGKMDIKYDYCPNLSLPLILDPSNGTISAEFLIYIPTEKEQGLYSLFFQNCPNFHSDGIIASVSFNLEVVERNKLNYLSAGDMPLPTIYFFMSVAFFFMFSIWTYVLRNSEYPVFKIHYLMALLTALKATALMFHSINLHFIALTGEHVAPWASLYYVTHILKGAVLFFTLILIGTGWTFVKHILSKKDKKIFMIVIPLQVFANIAEVVIEETEKGNVEYKTWMDICEFIDLICCGAILFPVIWSIRHLQEASQTDGKAAINLRKLKLFRHFYLMILCYIYATRIIVYLFRLTVPFQQTWLDDLFKETSTLVFFAITGYKFQPTAANPYFQATEENELDVV